jgi:glutamate racemase
MTGRRGLTVAVVACVAAAALALFAASRTWQIEIMVRPQPLPAVTTNR